MSRRGRGEGNIYRRADGRWMARITVLDDAGVKHRKAFYGPNRDAVDAKMTAARAGLFLGVPVLTERMTVDQLLTQWLAAIAGEVRPATLSGYRVNAWRHISPIIGSRRLTALKAIDVEQVMVAGGKRGLSPRSVQYIRSTLRVALQWALHRGLLARNVVDLTKGPKVERTPVQPLSAEQVSQFLAGVEGDRLRALYVLAFALGMRQGELLALRWEDIDLEAGTLRVVRTYQRRGRFGAPKSESSRRTLTLPAIVSAALERHRREQDREREIMAREEDHSAGLVFCNPHGRPVDPTTLGKWFHRHLERLGLPQQRFHDTRHAAASVLLAQHVPLRVVMEVLGHSQIALTANTYSHVMPALHREAAASMDAALAPEVKASGDSLTGARGGRGHLRLLSRPDSD